MPAPFAMVSSANDVTKIKDLLYAGHLRTLESCFRQEDLIGRLPVKHSQGEGPYISWNFIFSTARCSSSRNSLRGITHSPSPHFGGGATSSFDGIFYHMCQGQEEKGV